MSFAFGGKAVASTVGQTVRQQRLVLKDTLWRTTQPAWEVTCDRLRLVLTKHGLNIASVSIVDDPSQTSPMWVPQWQWSNPDKLELLNLSEEQAELYGNTEESVLLANICGHSLCLDRFGPSNDSDDLRSVHGEAPIHRWFMHSLSNEDVSFSCSLPISQLFLTRHFSFDGDRCYVRTSVQSSRSAYDRFMDYNEEASPMLAELQDQVIEQRNQAVGKVDVAGVGTLTETGTKKERMLLRYKRQAIDKRHNCLILQSALEAELKLRQQSDSLRKTLSLGLIDARQRREIEEKLLQIEREKKMLLKKDDDSNENDECSNENDQSHSVWKSFDWRSVFQWNNQKKDESEQKTSLMVAEKNNEDELIVEPPSDEITSKLLERSRFDIEWCEHVTISDPFLDGVNLSISHTNDESNERSTVEKCINFCLPMAHSRFDDAEPCSELELSKVLRMADQKGSGLEDCAALALDRNARWVSVKAENPRLGYELEYDFDAQSFPWLTLWMEDCSRQVSPWNGRNRCLGLEFTTKPFPIADLHSVLPNERVTSEIRECGAVCHSFDERPLYFELPFEGTVQCFSFRWNYIGVSE